MSYGQLKRLALGSWIVASCGVCTVVAAPDFPARKAGLWQIIISSPNSQYPPTIERVCLDATIDALLYKFGAGASQKMCSSAEVHSSGGKVIVDSACRLGSTQATTHSVTSFNSDTAYHTDVNVHYVPAMFGKSDMSSTQDAKWSGACPADMKPGDVVVQPSPRMPVPMKMNLNDMLKGSQ